MVNLKKEIVKHKEEICPVCGKQTLDYDTFEMTNGHSGFFKWYCNSCGSIGEEWHELKFICHENIK